MLLKFTAPLLLAATLATPALAQTTTRPPTILIHGNYCGPGNNAPLPPIDALDAACARHDACTPDGGLPTKACNLRLQREAALVSRDPRQPDDLRSLAGLISVSASMMLADTGSRSAPAVTAVPVSHDVVSPDAQRGPDARATLADGDGEDAE
ncbi:hypothetical protein [Methylobacterium sp. E-045]|uniref:hypothetical protein n=1 Tax=Methylobacterium sp. E-045 TaxID=2836575 RepID=UPI001FB9DF14|nr:hypothetical protein [Methylobacterium sp. E-045]MCJ2131114.1 hypothetical protein [Methylobacterium sp. E-045]